MRGIAILIIVMVFLAPTAAGAQSLTMEMAKRHYENGAAYYGQADDKAAMAEFRKAYKLEPAPALLHNLGRCHEGLGELAEAIKLYEEYLKKQPTATNRQYLERRIINLHQMLTDLPTDQKVTPPDAGPSPCTWTAKSIQSTSTDLRALWGLSSSEMWAVGGVGRIYHYTKGKWFHTPPNHAAAKGAKLTGVWGDATNFFVTGGQYIFHRHGSPAAWSTAASASGKTFDAVGGRHSGNRLLAGGSTLWFWQGTQWADTQLKIPAKIKAVWGNNATEVYMVGGDKLLRYNVGATSITPFPFSGASFSGVWGAGNTVFAVTDDGSGKVFTKKLGGNTGPPMVVIPKDKFHGVWGSSETSVWVVGNKGIYYYNGSKWTYLASPVGKEIYAIYGFGPTDVWAVGQGAYVYRCQ